jgi:non-ribosomal peptide synthetase component E (peptide arylation enzyme)
MSLERSGAGFVGPGHEPAVDGWPMRAAARSIVRSRVRGTVATTGELLPEAARRFGDKASLVVEDETFGFAELEMLSNRVANGLVSVAVLPGDRSRCTARTAGSGSSPTTPSPRPEPC